MVTIILKGTQQQVIASAATLRKIADPTLPFVQRRRKKHFTAIPTFTDVIKR